MKTSTIQQFEQRLRGLLIRPDDENYDQVRSLYNAMNDKRPALIARCVNAGDVVSAVNFGRDNDLLIAIRGGGHNGSGLGSCDDGLMIDLSLMKGVHVDPGSRKVRVEPGCTQGDMDHATHAFGLAVPAGIVSTTGVGGLTLGGGHGYLSRQYGLTVDNLLAVDVVLADGSFVTASANQHQDLFWALRGGGGNFGAVTSFLFQAHPVSHIFGGPIFWDVGDARQVMEVYRQFLPRAPRELSPFLGLKTVPSAPLFPEAIWGRKICALITCYNGPAEKAEALLKPMRNDLPEPIFAHMGTMPFPMIQSLFDPLLPPGMQWYWKGDYVHQLTDVAIDAHLEYAARAPSDLSLMHLYPIDGAVHDVDVADTAWPCRDATWSMVIAGISPDAGQADAISNWARNYWQAVHLFNQGGGYVNFMMEDGDERVKASYGENYHLLAKIKAKYDPDNLFRVNQNIKPAG